jgi:hypothetical protein
VNDHDWCALENGLSDPDNYVEDLDGHSADCALRAGAGGCTCPTDPQEHSRADPDGA